jgi:glycosyltransferase involved in cell wall biosynthesis
MISVIVPTFNRISLLERALNSVLQQTWTDFELIVVDDGSTDGTVGRLTELKCSWPQNQIRIVASQTNCGVSHARNRGIEEAKGQWLAFLDSDDEWHPKKLELQMQIVKETSVKWVHSEEIWIRNGTRVNPKLKHGKGPGSQFINSLKLCCISPSAVLIHRSLTETYGNFREDYPVCEDYELWLRLTLHEPIGFTKQALLTKYGGHEDQLSRRYFAMDYWRVKAMYELAHSYVLSIEQLSELKKEILFKTAVLLQGYEKHQNLSHVSEVQKWREWAHHEGLKA